MVKHAAFGCGLKGLARAGQPPLVLLDSLRCLAVHGLNTPALFASPVDKRQLLALKEAYEGGRRPVRGTKAVRHDPRTVANLLLLWLGALPEPLFPSEYVPELLQSQRGGTRSARVAAVRSLLKKTEPFIVEALFPLFELLHHYWINQPGREATLQELGELFAPPLFGTPGEHGASPNAAAVLASTAELMVAEYRPLFTQPYNLQRYEADLARQAAAAEAAAAAAEATLPAAVDAMQPSSPVAIPQRCPGSSVPLDGFWIGEGGSPLLTPRRVGSISVFLRENSVSPEADSPMAGDAPASLTDPQAWAPLRLAGTSSAPPDDHENDYVIDEDDMAAVLEGLLASTVSAAFDEEADCAAGEALAHLAAQCCPDPDDCWSPPTVLDGGADGSSCSEGSESCEETSDDMDVTEERPPSGRVSSCRQHMEGVAPVAHAGAVRA